jgi:uncharacterized protein (TIGR02270 family)
VLWDVVEEHLDEAAFLSGQWEAALVSPDLTLASVADGPEERLLAHVDGLLTAGAAARERVLEPALVDDDRERVFAAALALLESPGRERSALVAERLARAAPPSIAPCLRALELAHRPGIERELLALAGGDAPRAAAPALEALAFRGVPVPPEILLALGAPRAPPPLASAVIAAARWAGPKAIPLVERALGSPVVAVRDAAVETGLALGLRAAWTACRKVAQSMRPGSQRPLLALALGGDASDVETLARAAGVEELRPSALFALGFTGRVAAAEVSLTLMRDEKVARLAGEAFSAITGVAIAGELRAPEPAPTDEPVPLEQEDLDANLVPGPEAALPLPAADAVEGWWKRSGKGFDPRVRYLGGRPWDAAAVQAALAGGSMRRRHALGLDLAVRSGGTYALQTRGWAAHQLRHLAEHPLAPRSDFTSSYGRLLRD